MALVLSALSPVTVQGDLREPLALKAAVVAAGIADLEVNLPLFEANRQSACLYACAAV